MTCVQTTSPTAEEVPLLTVLNYSGGRQSACILWMVLRGLITRPPSFVVLNADPGMENSGTYKYNEMMFEECRKAGIEAFTVAGPNLYRDLTHLRKGKKTRLDNPPYWTKDGKGKRGKLVQKCTQFYKIAPMDRAIRVILEERFGISRKSKRLPAGCVRKWIGFSFDEVYRIKPSRQQYVRFEYPLIDVVRMDRAAVEDFFFCHSIPMPPRSVCNACFANGLNTLKEMHDARPADWRQAVEVDEAVRSLQQIGVKEEVYVSSTLLSLKDLAARNFDLSKEGDMDNYSCDSGYCFT